MGNPFSVNGNKFFDCFNEHIFRNGGHAKSFVGILHAFCVFVRTEKMDGTVFPAVSFHAFKNFLSVMENHAAGVKFKGGIGNDSSVVPAFSFGIVHKEHVVAEGTSEAKFAFVGGSGFRVFGICYRKSEFHLG